MKRGACVLLVVTLMLIEAFDERRPMWEASQSARPARHYGFRLGSQCAHDPMPRRLRKRSARAISRN